MRLPLELAWQDHVQLREHCAPSHGGRASESISQIMFSTDLLSLALTCLPHCIASRSNRYTFRSERTSLERQFPTPSLARIEVADAVRT